jgi:hypothetical protein
MADDPLRGASSCAPDPTREDRYFGLRRGDDGLTISYYSPDRVPSEREIDYNVFVDSERGGSVHLTVVNDRASGGDGSATAKIDGVDAPVEPSELLGPTEDGAWSATFGWEQLPGLGFEASDLDWTGTMHIDGAGDSWVECDAALTADDAGRP